MQFTTGYTLPEFFGSCLLWCKDTNFNAIHNNWEGNVYTSFAVYYGAKILILMQFTTSTSSPIDSEVLFIMVQRY